jgi:predicted dehydrogenase
MEALKRIGENLVAMCDVNEQRAARAFRMAPDTPKHHDYRRMLDELEGQIDAVMVATSDHHHAPCSAKAMKMGKPVYCEKPLTLTVQEARQIRQIARETGVATQMGNQGTASDAFREQVEILQTGGLGEIREVYVWQRTNRGGPQTVPVEAENVPSTLQWDLWIGPRSFRPYHRAWLRWGSWRDFGTGQLGNWASHAANMAFRGLKLYTLWDAADAAQPEPRVRVRPKVSAVHRESFPEWEIIDFKFPARGSMPAVTIHWFKSDTAPGFPENLEKLSGGELGGSGCLVVGERGRIVSSGHNSGYRLMQTQDAEPIRRPEPFLPRHGSHEREWLDTIRGTLNETMSNFQYAGRLIETLMLGNVATLLGREIEYDPIAGVCVGDNEATAALNREHREGWKL